MNYQYVNFKKLFDHSKHTIGDSSSEFNKLVIFKVQKYGFNHRGLAFWYNIGLVSFLVVAVGLAAMIMTSGFTSSDVTKEVLEEALTESRQGLEVQGKISAVTDVANDEVLTTATPITVATGGTVDLSVERFHLSYKLIKVDSSEIRYDNIHTGVLKKNSYNSINSAMSDAKKAGLIEINPYEDEKPTTTTAFIYWIINLNEDDKLDSGELAVIAIVYAEQDRPHTREYIIIEGFTPEGKILSIHRNVPNISGTVVDFRGKISP